MANKRKCASLDKKATPAAEDNKNRRVKKRVSSKTGPNMDFVWEGNSCFVGEPVLEEKAKDRWPERYQTNENIQAKCHYEKAQVDGITYSLGDDAFANAEEGKEYYICKIVEIFEGDDGNKYYTAQWYYRASDTVIEKKCSDMIDEKCIFFSDIKNVNLLDCLIKKLTVVHLPPKADKLDVDEIKSTCDFYFDKKYLLQYSSFVSFPPDTTTHSGDTDFNVVSGDASTMGSSEPAEVTMLDMYAGCGAMSTGLCLGANSCGVKLVTKWAVDFNQYACESFEKNHPETKVRNESADDFFALLKEWENLCVDMLSPEKSENRKIKFERDDEDGEDGEEVDEILDICYGDPNNEGTSELHFKISWKGYGPDEDSWVHRDCLSSCQEKLKEFVSSGHKERILPLPGSIDVICGGPPCQGISGFNRHRNEEAPLDDYRNEQLIVFMNIVGFLRPKIVLMENVVDILRFSGGFLGRNSLGSLVAMGYQARIGMMAAGSYGLPQFRRRMFMWGALPTERLPEYPLPTHAAVGRVGVPKNFKLNEVAHEEGHILEPALYIGDAISDLPPVKNGETREDRPYGTEPKTEFQRLIRLPKDGMTGRSTSRLYDHLPLRLNDDDYERVCKIPKEKGANFRNLEGVIVCEDNTAMIDISVERQTLTSGNFLVPDYAISFVKGTSKKPFGRVWWDETVGTVVTRAEPHNQIILHPTQNRVLTVRENARLQGFPDYYKLCGSAKEKYIQVGNAVAVPVARALGKSLASAFTGTER